MDYVWFIIFKGKEKGPYSFQDLQRIKEITPDTLAWREGMETWLPIRRIPELKKLFEDKDNPSPTLDEVLEGEPGSDDLALSLTHVEPPSYFWLFIIVTIIIYVLLQFYT